MSAACASKRISREAAKDMKKKVDAHDETKAERIISGAPYPQNLEVERR